MSPSTTDTESTGSTSVETICTFWNGTIKPPSVLAGVTDPGAAATTGTVAALMARGGGVALPQPVTTRAATIAATPPRIRRRSSHITSIVRVILFDATAILPGKYHTGPRRSGR